MDRDQTDPSHDPSATDLSATEPSAAASDVDADARELVSTAEAPAAIDPERLDALAGLLVWRIGRTGDEGPVTVRVGLAGAATGFADLPKLRSASDAELREAIDAGDVRVEWVGTGR